MFAYSRKLLRALGAVGLLVAPSALAAQHAHTSHSSTELRVPESMRIEHEEIHSRLLAATRAPGAVGLAARELAAVLEPHFQRENQIALPPLVLLVPLARGEEISDVAKVLPMTDSLRAELPAMLADHVVIGARARKLEEVAHEAGNTEVHALAKKLQAHAKSEEEFFYPAAVLVGDVIRARRH